VAEAGAGEGSGAVAEAGAEAESGKVAEGGAGEGSGAVAEAGAEAEFSYSFIPFRRLESPSLVTERPPIYTQWCSYTSTFRYVSHGVQNSSAETTVILTDL
jgi:hypothetical protein